MNAPSVAHDWRREFAGLEMEAPLLDGRMARFVNFDNAASTPPLLKVVQAIERFLPYYAAVHRGMGFKARVSTKVYDDAHATIAAFVGASPDTNTVIIGKNTTDAINKLAYRLPLAPDSVIVSTMMEHHSNDLPWRRAQLVRARVGPDGRLDEDHVDDLLAQFGRRVALVTITGASNVTGYVQPIHRLARKAHAVGAKVLVDAAQLAPHRRIGVKPDDDPEHLDFVALSAHKLYAPFGAGALVGARLEHGDPLLHGGGAIKHVTLDDVLWAEAPDRHEAGSPNVIGAVALGAACRALSAMGMDELARRERALAFRLWAGLAEIPGLQVHTLWRPGDTDRVGVATFTLDGFRHPLLAAILSAEHAIGVRHGCFCAHPLITRLLQVPEAEAQWLQAELRSGREPELPGAVRASIGLGTTVADIDALTGALDELSRRR